MAESQESNVKRLENLQAIEPLLGSLRVLSLSSLQMAHNRQEALQDYAQHFKLAAAQLAAAVNKRELKAKKQESKADRGYQKGKTILAVLGSTRGIVGQYNRRLARQTKELAEKHSGLLEVWAYGDRVQRALTQEGVAFLAKQDLSAGSRPNYEAASETLRSWLEQIEQGELERVLVLSFRKRERGSSYELALTRLLPESRDSEVDSDDSVLPWPEPIIEVDPAVILQRIRLHLRAIDFYELILDGVAAENFYRYRLLEEAKENTSKLLEELAQAIHIERRREITQQLQELLSGSGMLLER